MFKFIGTLVLAFGLAGAANAFGWPIPGWRPPPPPRPFSAPEIDPASALGALTLLGGTLLVLRGRSLKK